MKSNSAVFVQPSLRFKVGSMGKFRRLEIPNRQGFIANLNSCFPLNSISGYAQKPMRVVGPASLYVLIIFALRNILQVCNSVVAFVAVYVVNVEIRPQPINKEPRSAMRFKSDSINPYAYVSIVPDGSGNIAHIDSVGRSDFARENAGKWIVMKKFAQAFCGKIGVSHDAVLSLIGQRPARVDSTCWPRHFTAIDSIGVIA